MPTSLCAHLSHRLRVCLLHLANNRYRKLFPNSIIIFCFFSKPTIKLPSDKRTCSENVIALITRITLENLFFSCTVCEFFCFVFCFCSVFFHGSHVRGNLTRETDCIMNGGRPLNRPSNCMKCGCAMCINL